MPNKNRPNAAKDQNENRQGIEEEIDYLGNLVLFRIITLKRWLRFDQRRLFGKTRAMRGIFLISFHHFSLLFSLPAVLKFVLRRLRGLLSSSRTPLCRHSVASILFLEGRAFFPSFKELFRFQVHRPIQTLFPKAV